MDAKRTYHAPTLKKADDLVAATLACCAGALEPDLPNQPQVPSGSIGYGL